MIHPLKAIIIGKKAHHDGVKHIPSPADVENESVKTFVEKQLLK